MIQIMILVFGRVAQRRLRTLALRGHICTGVCEKTHSLSGSPCLAILRQKLLSSPWSGAPKTHVPISIIFRRSVFCHRCWYEVMEGDLPWPKTSDRNRFGNVFFPVRRGSACVFNGRVVARSDSVRFGSASGSGQFQHYWVRFGSIRLVRFAFLFLPAFFSQLFTISEGQERMPGYLSPPAEQHMVASCCECSRSSEGGWCGWKSSSSSNFSIRVVRAYPLIAIWQTAPCRAIRGNGISVDSTLPPSYLSTRSLAHPLCCEVLLVSNAPKGNGIGAMGS